MREFWTEHPEAQGPLSEWYKVATRNQWRKFADVRAIYATADKVGRFVVFNVGGNKYRLVAEIIYDHGVVLIRDVLTHEDYDRGRWKKDPGARGPRRRE